MVTWKTLGAVRAKFSTALVLPRPAPPKITTMSRAYCAKRSASVTRCALGVSTYSGPSGRPLRALRSSWALSHSCSFLATAALSPA
jgi:hypothetical protein